MNDVLAARIRDRLNVNWLTPSQKRVWEDIQHFDGPIHRVVNIYGATGTGKTFLGWLMDRLNYATYSVWTEYPKPLLPRLVLDDTSPERALTRSLRPIVDQHHIQQLILLSQSRVDEQAMPAFELRVTQEDMEMFQANLYRHLEIIIPEVDVLNYKSALAHLA